MAATLGPDAELLEAAEWLHDIGYLPELARTGPASARRRPAPARCPASKSDALLRCRADLWPTIPAPISRLKSAGFTPSCPVNLNLRRWRWRTLLPSAI
ncbi:MAG TPA: hypothetical protein VN969_09210 [Streptosporangiaceae bacterium]|nr:hypothetical protein [Streptosporangiaceae bacterium]